MKKLLCFSLCLIILLGMLPMGVFAQNTTRLYCQAPDNWTNCNVYWWGSAGTNPGWPGEPMTQDAEGIWMYDVPADAPNVIFNNGSNRTADLTMPTDDNVMFVFAESRWTTYDKVEVVTQYFVAGSSELCGVAWDPDDDDNRMAEGVDGWYTKTYYGIPAGECIFKITDGTWNRCWGDPSNVDGNGNIVFQAERTSNEVSISFQATTKNIKLNVNGNVTYYNNNEHGTTDPGENNQGNTGSEDTEPVFPPVAPEDPKQIVEDARALGENESLPYVATLTGKVISIDQPYDDIYKNVTLTISVAGYNGSLNIICYRMKGSEAQNVAAGDTITVNGVIKRYVNEEKDIDMVEFYNCKLLEYAAITRTLYVQVPDTWNRLFAYTWEPTDLGDWPGTALQKNGDWYTATIKGSTENLVLSDGTDSKKTPNITLPKGFGDLWIAVDHLSGFTIYNEEPDLRTYTLRVEVPRSWGNTVSVYSWAPDVFGDWPGTPMVFNGDCYEITLPASVQNLMINDYVGSTGNKSNSLLIEPNQDVYIVIHASGEVDIYNGHGAHDYRSVNVPACCTVGAHTAMVCQVCGAEKPGSASAATSPALGHDYRTTVVAPTCTDSGYTLHTCARCQESYAGGTSQPLGHYFANYISNDDATCTADGTKTGYCIRCEQKCTVADPDSALGHQFTHYMDDMNATCSADGTKTAKCDRCSATDTVAAPGSALGHQYVNGFCYYCGTAQLFDQGDVNGDGKINMADVAKTFAHVRGKSKITNENILLSADLNKDGKINIGDVARLYAIVRGKQVF